MSFSIGSSGSTMGPANAIQNFGEHKGDRAFDLRIALRLLGYLRPYGRRMAVSLVLVIFSSLLTLSVPYLMKIAIDQAITQGDSTSLTQLSLMIAGDFILIYITTAVVQYQLSWVGQKFLASLRAQLFRHLQALSLAYHDNHIAGVTISHVINDVAVINDLLSQGIITFAGDGF